jgi:hypothetical protein
MGAVLRFRSSPKIAQSRRPAASGPAAAQLQAVCASVGARPNPEDDARPAAEKKGSFLPHAAGKGGDACRRGARD